MLESLLLSDSESESAIPRLSRASSRRARDWYSAIEGFGLVGRAAAAVVLWVVRIISDDSIETQLLSTG